MEHTFTHYETTADNKLRPVNPYEKWDVSQTGTQAITSVFWKGFEEFAKANTFEKSGDFPERPVDRYLKEEIEEVSEYKRKDGSGWIQIDNAFADWLTSAEDKRKAYRFKAVEQEKEKEWFFCDLAETHQCENQCEYCSTLDVKNLSTGEPLQPKEEQQEEKKAEDCSLVQLIKSSYIAFKWLWDNSKIKGDSSDFFNIPANGLNNLNLATIKAIDLQREVVKLNGLLQPPQTQERKPLEEITDEVLKENKLLKSEIKKLKATIRNQNLTIRRLR